jgi:hypothetical protein
MNEQATAPATTVSRTQPKKTPDIVQRHKRLFTYVGGIIVFFTFVAREEVREHFRAEAASIESAQVAFSMEEGFRRLQAASKNPDYALRQHVFSSMQELIDRLHNPYISVTVKDVDQKEDVIYDTQHEADNYVDSHHNLSIEEITRIAKEAEHKVASLELALNQDIDNLAHALNDEALRARRRADLYSSISDWAGFALYTLGWGLGLVGRLVGVGDVGGEE